MRALAHLGLARAYALDNDAEKAKPTYQDFLNLWKDAAPRHPHPKTGQEGVRENIGG